MAWTSANATFWVRSSDLIDLHVELGEVLRGHDEVDFSDLAVLDGEHERRPDLTTHRPYRAGFTVDERVESGLRATFEGRRN
jgi:hypothetical protein